MRLSVLLAIIAGAVSVIFSLYNIYSLSKEEQKSKQRLGWIENVVDHNTQRIKQLEDKIKLLEKKEQKTVVQIIEK